MVLDKNDVVTGLVAFVTWIVGGPESNETEFWFEDENWSVDDFDEEVFFLWHWIVLGVQTSIHLGREVLAVAGLQGYTSVVQPISGEQLVGIPGIRNVV